MTIDVQIDLFVGIGAVGGDFLTLDDPIKGELDEALYPLFDPVGPDIIEDIAVGAYSYRTRRGRASEIDVIDTGTLAVDVRNHDAAYQFDRDGIDPGRRVRVAIEGVTVIDATVEDWNYTYEPSGASTASLTAVDALGVLARKDFDEWTTTASQTAGTRIASALDRGEVGFPSGSRDLEAGATSLQADLVSWGSNVLNYLQLVAKTELGRLFATRDGVLTFRQRRTFVYDVSATFSDDGVEVPFVGIQPVYGAETLFNRVSVDRVGGTQQTAEDTTSQDRYGVRTLSLSGLLMDTDAAALDLADMVLSLYSAPAVRIQGLTVALHGITLDQRIQVLALDIGDAVAVTWTPPGAVTPVEQALIIEGISMSGTSDGAHYMDLSLSPTELFPTPFIFDDAIFGLLDTGRLDY